MSMHDEFERAIAGSSRKKGLGALGWLAVSLGLFLVVGVVGVGFAMNRLVHKAEQMVGGFDFDAGAAASKVVARLESHTRLLSADPDQGMEFLRNLDGEDPTEALMGRIFDGSVSDAVRAGDDPADLADLAELVEIGEPRTGSLRARDGDVSIDLQRAAEGGSLVIRSDDGTVRLDLRRTPNGASLVIDSDEGHARIGMRRTENGGSLRVESDEGDISFDLIRSDEGGQLLVNTDGGESLRLAFGDDAELLPSWVPQLDGMPERPRPVYSLRAGEGMLGAVSWRQDISAGAALERYQAQLEEAGYGIRVEHQRDGAEFDEGSLWAKDETSGRLVFVVARETAEGTKVLVGYGEETR